MSSFDFNKLTRPSAGARPINPIEIFRAAPALTESVNDLWQGQSKALEQWHQARAKRDVLISLHTGAGKSLVGLLIAQSLVHEGVPHVLYACATNDLVQQTSREIEGKLGFAHATRMGGKFSNDLYSTGGGFCLTNYQALFNGRSVFTKDQRPNAILFDDAHVAEKIIRECYTVKIDASANSKLFNAIITLLIPHFSTLHHGDKFRSIVNGDSVQRVVLVPPSAVLSLVQSHDLLRLMREHDLQKGESRFALEHIADHLHACTIFVSQNAIEIAPAFLPSKRIPFLADRDIRRIYLSATMRSEVDFCRAFGRRPSEKIEPESDAGMGERLIVLSDRETLTDGSTKGVKDDRVAAILSAKHKVLVSTSSYASAAKYATLATPPATDQFTVKLDQFRRSNVSGGAFILVGRIDGIDLPHATCRVMLADSLPLGFSLFEIFLYDVLEMRNSFSAKLANRITQLFGRTNRGRNDYSVVFVTDKKFKAWLSTPRNVALLPELLRKQIGLGQSLVDQLKITDVRMFPQLAQQVISRDSGWLSFYKDSIAGSDVPGLQRDQAYENDVILTDAALTEADCGAEMWDNNTQAARAALGEIVDRVVVADRRLAGWYNIQIGHTYEIEGDSDAAAKQYAEAKSRTNFNLPLPIPRTSQSAAREQEPKNPLHLRLLEIFRNDIRLQNDSIDKYERSIKPLFDPLASTNQHEEAARAFGELLGFDATRPEQEAEDPSTLDVLWVAPKAKQAILVEMKTKKLTDSPINAGEVGQVLQHIEWAKKSAWDTALLGLIIVGGSPSCTKEAAPSADIWVSEVAAFKRLFDEIVQTLRALQRLSPLERYAEINSIVLRPEWQPITIFEKLRGKQLITAFRHGSGSSR